MAVNLITMALSQNVCFKDRVRLRRGKANDLYEVAGHTRGTPRSAGGGGEDALVHAEQWPELLNYKVPSRMVSDEIAVLEKYLGDLREPTEAERELQPVGLRMLQESIGSFDPPCWNNGVVSVDVIIAALCVGGRSKSPGHPLKNTYQTKGEAFDDALADLVQAVCVRLLANQYVTPLTSDPYVLYEAFCCDAVAFSIKNEVVKTSKLGRPLGSYSYVDAAYERLWSYTYSMSAKETVYEKHSAIGIGFTPNDAMLLRASVGEGPYFLSDVPGWDGSVTHDENRLVTLCALRCMNASPLVQRLALAHCDAMARRFYVLSDGRVLLQVRPGGQITGRDLTSRLNTDERALRSYCVDAVLLDRGFFPAELPLCAGDDCVEHATLGREAVYDEIGYPLRDAVVTYDLRFCSFEWYPVVFGERLDKAVFNLLLKPPIDLERFKAFVVCFSHHPRFQNAIAFISMARVEVKDIMNDLLQKYVPHAKKKAKGKGAANQQQPKKKKEPREKAPGNRMMNPKKSAPPPVPPRGVKTAHHAMLKSMCSPFSPESIGCKYPDGLSGASLATQFRALFQLTCLGTAPNGLYAFTPGLTFNTLGASAITTGTYAWGPAWTAQGSTNTANTWVTAGFTYRPVCGGIVLRSIQNAMVCQGTVVVTKMSQPPAVSGSWVGGTLQGTSKTYSLIAGMEVPILFKPVGTTAYQFVPGNGSSGGAFPSWDTVIVEVFGCSGNGAAVLEVDYIINYELEPPPSQVQYTSIATPSPADNPMVRKAASAAMQATTGIFDKGVEAAEKKLYSLAQDAIGDIWSLFV